MFYKFSATVNDIRVKGFALISVILVMSLLMIVAIACLSLSRMESRSSSNMAAQMEAEANARLGLMLAIARLQESAGPDQRVTARAAILEDADSGVLLPNRNWLGVWKTTHQDGGREWPLIGKCPDLIKKDEPYLYKGIYTDLRYQVPELRENEWREKLRLEWLVSRRNAEVDTPLDLLDSDTLEILGRGTLGDSSVVDEVSYLRDRVLVEKINITAEGKQGAYAWYISDNSQKASLGLGLVTQGEGKSALASSSLDNPSAILFDGGRPYASYVSDTNEHFDKILSQQSTSLSASSVSRKKLVKAAIGAQVHHFTTDSGGLFTDPVLGGFKKDLTALLFGQPAETRIEFIPPYPDLAADPFSSRYPIIPGQRKAAQGPSFAALRAWGQMKTSATSLEAQLTVPNEATRQTPVDSWVYGISDGKSFIASEWAEAVPKIRPVMTDCRYHYYYSFTGSGADQKLRTHLIPRVCVWNPYNISLEVDRLTVLMPNPFGATDLGSGDNTKPVHFFFSEEEVSRLKLLLPDVANVQKWVEGRIYLRGNQGGLFPDDRFLGFTLEKSTIEPGECLVFSPKISDEVESSQGISIQNYAVDDISKNVLSAREPQGEGHFVHDYASDYLKMKSVSGSKIILSSTVWKEMQLDEIIRYEGWATIQDELTFILKAGEAMSSATEASKSLMSLQTMCHGNGGTKVYQFNYNGDSWGDSGTAFGNLAHFVEAPRKDAPRLHQIGTKLLWLDESSTEANDASPAPLRVNTWDSESLAYNPSSIANWNVRPNLITRSPSSPVGKLNGGDTWYATSSGAWLQQFSPHSPQDFNDMPILTESLYFTKPALTLATQQGVASTMILFDLPDPDYGTLSMGSLRHAQLSPFSWHPTYIIGNSLVDLHAPFDASAHSQYFENSYRDDEVSTGWDYAIGGGRNGAPYAHGARVQSVDSQSLLQIGNFKSSVDLNGMTISHDDEQLVYDICFEVNQNLWDQFFFSGMKMNAVADGFVWNPNETASLQQLRYETNGSANFDQALMAETLKSSLDHGFWLNGYLLKNRAAFNVNSTSVVAWTAFLSGLRTIDRNGIVAGEDTIISRLRNPVGAATTDDAEAGAVGGWLGGRRVTDDEISLLASNIVREVKLRGPFVSLSDFVNRRLTDKTDEISLRGALEAAIMSSGLNTNFNQAPYLTTKVEQSDNNHPDFKPDVDKQAESKAWGIPGFITQADLIAPFAPAMTVRGDVFVIRSYGEARDVAGHVTAVAYLEACVERGAEYVKSMPVKAEALAYDSNRATDPALKLDYVTGELIRGNLSEVNQKYGRKLSIKSMRWLSLNEI